MICKFCGNEIEETAKFCRGCGASREEADNVVEGEAVDPIITEEPIPDEAFAEIPEIEEPKAETVFESDNSQTIAEEDSKPLRKRPHFLISLLCFIFMLIIFNLEMIFGALIAIRLTTSESAVSKVVSDIDFASIEIDVDGESKTFAEAIISEVTNKDVSDEDVEKIIEEFEGEEYFTGVITDLTEYMFNGGKAPKLDADELTDVIEDNKKIIEDVTGEKISDDELDNFRKTADDFVKNFNENIEEIDLIEDVNKITAALFTLDYFILIEVASILFFVFILVIAYKLNKSGVYRVFRAFAVPTGFVGLMLITFGFSLPVTILPLIRGKDEDIIFTIINAISTFPIYAGMILMVVCLLSIITSIVMYVIYTKNTRV